MGAADDLTKQEDKQAPASEVVKFIDSEIGYWKKHPDPDLAAEHTSRLQGQRDEMTKRTKK